MVRWVSEKSGGWQGDKKSMKTFNALICDVELIDVPLKGGSFTWSSNRPHVSSSKKTTNASLWTVLWNLFS